MRLTLTVLGCLLSTFIWSQQTVSGVVIDPTNNEALIGVNVIEKGTSNGTITDIEGNYTLTTTTDNPVLVFSFIGYQTIEETINGRGTVDISLGQDALVFDEVVVVGYGTQKKKVVTGAIAKVDAEELEDMQIDRIESALQGRTSGVRVTSGSGQPGEGATVRVRGTTTIGNSDPLYVVDGVVIGGGIDYLNQNDIESIEVLKDAAAASIYGTRAANGVILITTKSGKKNSYSINYNGFYGISNPWKKLPVLNAREYATLMNESFAAAGLNIPFEDPTIYGEGTNWQDHVFRKNAPSSNHNVSISAGGESATFFGSFSILEEDGIISDDNSNYRRINLRLNNTTELGKRITVGANAGYSNISSRGVSTNSEFGSPLSRALNLDPITPLYETDPEVLSNNVFSNFPVVSDENGVFGISEYVTSEILNPIAALAVGDGFGWSHKVVSNGFAEVEPIDNLKFKSSIGADLAFWGGEGFNPVHYLNATNRNDLNDYNRSQNRGLYWIWENTVSYDWTLSSHKFNFLLGTSAQKNKGQGIGGAFQDIPVDNLEDASLAFSVPADNQSFFGFEYEDRLSSVFGRVDYNFNEKYLLTATLRRDGSSKFGKNNLYGIFPGISLGWNVSDEAFFNVSAINYFKLRASWGINGNDRIGDFLFLPTVGTGANYTFGLEDQLLIGTTVGGIANPDLRWEETTQINIGFDAVFLKNFSLTFDIYQKNTDGILQTFEVPDLVGFGSPVANVGKMNNRGMEIDLGWNRSFGGVELQLGANLSYNENEVEFLTPDKDFLPGSTFGPQGLEMTRTIVGFPIGTFFGYMTDGIFQNQSEVDAHVNAEGEALQPNAAPGDFKFIDHNEDGVINNDDRTVIGDPTPKWTYGVPLELHYRGLELIVFGQGVWGNQIFKANRRFDLQMANLEGAALGRWTGEGTSTSYPRLIANDPNMNFSRSSDFYLESGSYFRVKNFQIGYTLPYTMTERARMSKAKVYFAINNALTFTNYSGFDPEIIGVDRGLYPQPRTFLVGLNVTFK